MLAAQPVLPLLAYDQITGPGGWALVLALVALVNLGLARSGVTVERPARQDLPSPGTPSAPRQRDAESRPEGDPEEAAELIDASARLRRPAADPPGARPA